VLKHHLVLRKTYQAEPIDCVLTVVTTADARMDAWQRSSTRPLDFVRLPLTAKDGLDAHYQFATPAAIRNNPDLWRRLISM
jgi:hypothetical protein